MKQHLFTAVIVLALFVAHESSGQFNQGRYIAGGTFDVSFSTTKSKTGSTVTTEFKSTNFGLSPTVGYFVIDNVAVGAMLNVSTGKTKYETGGYESSSSSMSIGPFVRYYLPAAIFFQGHATFGSAKSESNFTTPGSENKTGVFRWGLAAGYAWFLNDYVALEPMVGYQGLTLTDKEDDSKVLNGGMYLSAALTVYLGERK